METTNGPLNNKSTEGFAQKSENANIETVATPPNKEQNKRVRSFLTFKFGNAARSSLMELDEFTEEEGEGGERDFGACYSTAVQRPVEGVAGARGGGGLKHCKGRWILTGREGGREGSVGGGRGRFVLRGYTSREGRTLLFYVLRKRRWKHYDCVVYECQSRNADTLYR